MIEKKYNNYHKHTDYSNIRTPDTHTRIYNYFDRMLELGHRKYFTMEHGYQGNCFDVLNIIEEYNKKLPLNEKFEMVVGSEVYFIPDYYNEDGEINKGYYHLVITALNNKGVEELNSILSKANDEGFYRKPRVDLESVMSLTPKNFIVTSACVAGICRDRDLDLILKFKKHFNKNFYLEVQNHNEKTQIELNKWILNVSKKYDIDIIHANDSHYIYPEDAYYRQMFLTGKGMNYGEEDTYCLDYPTYNDIVKRYREQGVLSEEEVIKALDNTLIFDELCEPITIYNTDIKIPKISNNPNKEFKKLLNNLWKKEKKYFKKEKYKDYIEAIQYEADIIEKTSMEEYFLIDYKICKRAVEKYDCLITETGRGSAGSFLINTLLGLTGLDRLDSPVTLYPTRFMSTSRILETKSLPDIDINCSNQEALIKASEDILGSEKCGWLISFKPLQKSSAFRLWCKAKKMPHELYNEVAKNIDDYVNHPKWGEIIKESSIFVGVIESFAPSPCSILLGTKPIETHIGYIRVGDKKNGTMCCNLDGYNCDKYKYLKND